MVPQTIGVIQMLRKKKSSYPPWVNSFQNGEPAQHSFGQLVWNVYPAALVLEHTQEMDFVK